MSKGNSKIIEMMSLSEEISNINTKVRQLVEDLHSTQGVLLNLQDLTSTLSDKVVKFKSDVSSYKPENVTEAPNGAKPSYLDSSEEPHRIVPTPENQHKYKPEPIVSTTYKT